MNQNTNFVILYVKDNPSHLINEKAASYLNFAYQFKYLSPRSKTKKKLNQVIA